MYCGHGLPGRLWIRRGTYGEHELWGPNPENKQNDEAKDVYYLAKLPGLDLQRCALALLVACSSARESSPGAQDSVAHAFFAKGADCVIGFTHHDLQPDAAKAFSDAFWTALMRDGKTIAEAITAGDGASGSVGGIETLKLLGEAEATATLRPGRYGQ